MNNSKAHHTFESGAGFMTQEYNTHVGKHKKLFLVSSNMITKEAKSNFKPKIMVKIVNRTRLGLSRKVRTHGRLTLNFCLSAD